MFRLCFNASGSWRLDVIHAGDHSFALAKRARAVAITRLFDDTEPLA